MKPGDAARLLNLGRSTITAWTLDPAFKDFFTPAAQGGSGRSRSLADHDIRVLHFIGESRRQNVSIAEIIVSLRAMQEREWIGLPDMPEAPVGMANVPVMPTAAAEATISGERRMMLREITLMQARLSELTAEVEHLRSQLDTRNHENVGLVQKLTQVETELRLTRDTVMTAAEAHDLTRRITEAETHLRFYQEGRIRSDDGMEAERDELLRRLSEAETELKLYRAGRLRPDGE